jgi:hypothetical protein
VRRRPAARLPLVLGAAALGVGVLAAPASADTGVPPAAPVVAPSTAGPISVGTPMTMAIAPGSTADQVYGYAWTWQSPSNVPTYSSLPACGSDEGPGGIHFVCGSAVTLRVSPEDPPFGQFTVWAFDAAGHRSAGTTTQVNTLSDATALYPVTHQWTTDQYWTVPALADCGPGALTVACVPDTAGVDDRHSNGADPLLLPSGVTWDGSGAGVPGVLTFGGGNALPAGTLRTVVDPRQSFTVGAWLTPTGTGVMTAVAEGVGRTGFELGLSAEGSWQFRLRSGAATAAAVAGARAMTGLPVYVAGVWDAVNHEVRLYVDGSLAGVTRFAPHGGSAALGGVTVGGRLSTAGFTERWRGQVGNPVVAQAALTGMDIGLLSYESFFPGNDGGLD